MSCPDLEFQSGEESLELFRAGVLVGHATLVELDAAAYRAQQAQRLDGALPADLLALEGPVLSLEDLEVHGRSERGQGLGRALLAEVLARQSQLGCPLVAEVNRGDLGASRHAGADLLLWYARHGFRALLLSDRKLAALLIRDR